MIEVILIGAGPRGLAHLSAWPRAGGRVVAVVEPDETRRTQLSLSGLKTFDNLGDAVAGEPRAQLVDICTAPAAHKQLIIEGLALGLHVLCEKPFVATLEEAAEIERAAESSASSVVAMHNWLGHPAVQALRRKVASGSMGKLLAVQSTWLQDHRRDTQGIKDPHHWVHSLGGGRLEETLPHIIYTLVAILQDPTLSVQSAVFSKNTNYEWVEADTVEAVLTGNRGRASLYLTFAVNHDHIEFTAVGLRSSATANLDTRVVDPLGVNHNDRGKRAALERLYWLLDGIARRAHLILTNTWASLRGRHPDADVWLMSEFVQSIEHGTPPPVSLAEAIATVRITRELCDRMRPPTSP